MVVCDLYSSCSCGFFKKMLIDFPALSAYLMSNFCKDGFPNCARYLVYKEFGRDKIPIGLYPDDTFR